MKIIQTRIRFPENYLAGINNDEEFYIGLTGLQNFSSQLENIGFGRNISSGDQVLPSIVGNITRLNANGSFKKNRDLPKETVFWERDIKDWHGYPHTVDIAYKRYPRETIYAPNIELLIQLDAANNLILTSPKMINNKQNLDLNKHVINMFLEIFGECEILKVNLLPSFNINVKRLNWDILPKGTYPWKVLAPRLQNVIDKLEGNRRILIKPRLEKISEYEPNFVAIGNAGFHGYLIFGFESKTFYILESAYTGNATYVLGQDWEQLSQMTKGQILTQGLHEERIIHANCWEKEIDNLLK